MGSNMTVYKRFLNNCISGNIDTVRNLINSGLVNPSEQNNYAVICAARDNRIEVIKELIKDERVDASDDNNKAIRIAYKNGNYDIVKILFDIEKVNNKLKKYQPNIWYAINDHNFD